MPDSANFYVALLHYPMRDKNGDIVTTAVTNLDIHDIARSSRTYGVKTYFLVNPLAEQQDVVRRIIGHWQGPGGRDYNPDRSEAFERVQIVSYFEDVVAAIQAAENAAPEVFMTTAKRPEGLKGIGWADFRRAALSPGRPKLLVFGTGWGMTEDFLRRGDAVLDPIVPEQESGYNHLSVRSAVAIALDRVLGSHKI